MISSNRGYGVSTPYGVLFIVKSTHACPHSQFFLSIHELIICKLENHTTHQTANLSLMSVHRTKTTLLCFQCGLPDPPAAEPFLFHACPFISSTDCELSTCFLFIKSRNFLSHIISWLQVSSFSSKFWSTSHPIQVHSLSVSRQKTNSLLRDNNKVQNWTKQTEGRKLKRRHKRELLVRTLRNPIKALSWKK